MAMGSDGSTKLLCESIRVWKSTAAFLKGIACCQFHPVGAAAGASSAGQEVYPTPHLLIASTATRLSEVVPCQQL